MTVRPPGIAAVVGLLVALRAGASPLPASGPDLLGRLDELAAACAAAESLERAAQDPGPAPDPAATLTGYRTARDRADALEDELTREAAAALEAGRLDLVGAVSARLDGASGCLAGFQARLSRLVRQAGAGAAETGRALTLERLALGLAPRPAPAAAPGTAAAGPPIQIAFHWHMHQPIYWPDEDLEMTERRGVYSFDLFDLFRQRLGPYTTWPWDAVRQAVDAGLPAAGAQVSFSGSLIEDLDVMARVDPAFAGWSQAYRAGRHARTVGGNPRLDLVAFGYHHPLMALTGYEDVRRQVAAHRDAVQRAFGADVAPSRGIFPPENAFAEWMVPALVDEGLQWVMVDNIHFSRACRGYPWVAGENLPRPNPAEQRNPDPGGWVQLQGLWAPSKVSAWADRPHWVVALDPDTGLPSRTPDGKVARMIAVPTDRYMGNEDGRGGFGALDYERVMSQLEAANTDPAHPLLIVLHHDGDNYGGGSWGYYHDNFARFVAWVKARPDRFACTTVQDYLDRWPPAEDDVIHVEPGSWAGADNGDPEFLKWNGRPDATGYSPDRNSWGVLTAARNLLAEAGVRGVPGQVLAAAERFLSVGQTSCYEYWDGTEMWDSHPTRAANLLAACLAPWLATGRADRVPPALYLPQSDPLNPSGDFTVWTYAFDRGGLEAVRLRYRLPSGAEAGTPPPPWTEVPMQGREIPPKTNPLPRYKAAEFAARIPGVRDATVEYQVVAVDRAGNRVESPVLAAYVGAAAPVPTDPAVVPAEPGAGEPVRISSGRAARLHWGVNGWSVPPRSLWPLGTQPWPDGKAVESPMEPGPDGRFAVTLPASAGAPVPVTRIDLVLHYLDGTWGSDRWVPIR